MTTVVFFQCFLDFLAILSRLKWSYDGLNHEIGVRVYTGAFLIATIPVLL
jgi:hypothetical protein